MPQPAATSQWLARRVVLARLRRFQTTLLDASSGTPPTVSLVHNAGSPPPPCASGRVDLRSNGPAPVPRTAQSCDRGH